MRDKPLVLVIDLDETIVYVDELHKLSPTDCTIFYRSEIYDFINYMRQWFKNNIFIILWSAGEDSYVREIVFRLNIPFDLILTCNDCDKSILEYDDTMKSVSYVRNHEYVNKWIKTKIMDMTVGSIVYAIIDDKAFENSSCDDPYTYTFCITPINLKTTLNDTIAGTMFATVESLFEIGDFLIYQCIMKPYVTFAICKNNNYTNNEIKFSIEVDDDKSNGVKPIRNYNIHESGIVSFA
ncbi:hypothetical protein B4U80_12322 [Leptotrombidium deliense]|uniref:FCP1 homology domain-containing protein n=1 Tax=Leptotrombidium deliense TaxID=299467 RepID=A0A443RVX5_9ACAR|nr:hypothetical protein B4U80_12322 [Leptotrombidium deliense]